MYSRRAVVLGGGAVAAAMAQDLSREPDIVVTVVGGDRDGWTSPDRLRAAVEDSHVVLSGVPNEQGLTVLRGVLEARRLCVDVATEAQLARTLDGLAQDRRLAACVGCSVTGIAEAIAAARGGTPVTVRWSGNEAATPDGPSLNERITAWTATALARRLLTGDFRDHWGVWTPLELGTRLGMIHGILEDLRLRGIGATIEPR